MDSNNVAIAATSRKDMIWNIQELMGDKKKT